MWARNLVTTVFVYRISTIVINMMVFAFNTYTRYTKSKTVVIYVLFIVQYFVKRKIDDLFSNAFNTFNCI